MDCIQVDVTVVGGGIIGILTAYEIKKKFPELEIVLLEATPFLGDHSTGRNSGVLHSGLYYDTHSLKHLLCMEGLRLWKNELCPRLGISYIELGKIIFSKNSDENQTLESIWKTATKNGVEGLEWAATSKLSSIRKFVKAESAFFSPTTGIFDVSDALKKLDMAFTNLGGIISRNCKVETISKNLNSFDVLTEMFQLNSQFLINAAGFFGPDLRNFLGLTNLKSVLVKGNYISTSQKLNHPHLFYPVPCKDLRGLGVHSTLDTEGNVKFGPNTEDVATIDYTESNQALLSMKSEILNTFVGIEGNRLYWDYAGIRSKIMDTDTDKLEKDFWIKSPIKNYIECLGIESPGLTSAPAIAKKIVRDFF